MQLKRVIKTSIAVMFCTTIAIGFNPTETMAEELLISETAVEESTELLEIEGTTEVPMLGESGEGWSWDEATKTLTISKNSVTCPYDYKQFVKYAVTVGLYYNIFHQMFACVQFVIAVQFKQFNHFGGYICK